MDAKALYMGKPWLKFYPEGVSPEIKITEQGIPEVFDEVTERYKNNTALIFYGKKISYHMLRELVDRFATALADLGVAKGSTVALFLLNCPQYVIAYFSDLSLYGGIGSRSLIGNLDLTSVDRSARSPCVIRWYPATAIIAPLSVQYSGRG